MKYAEEQLKKYGIKNVSAISEESFKTRIIVRNLDETKYIYDISSTLTESDVDDILEKHIKKYYIKEIRKEKLQKLNEI